jgi:hypothetical protein
MIVLLSTIVLVLATAGLSTVDKPSRSRLMVDTNVNIRSFVPYCSATC